MVRAHAIVDDEDYERVSTKRWYLHPDGYAIRSQGRRTVLLHREVAGLTAGDGLEVDHRDRNGLNNRRGNLRVGTRALNAQNLRPQLSARGVPPTSAHRGVCWDRTRGKWRASVGLNGKVRTIGRFDDEDEAARAASDERWATMPFAVEGEARGATE